MSPWLFRRVLPVALGIVLSCSVAGLSRGQGQNAPARLSPQSEISLITILPGEPVYSFAGHSALRVRDPASGMDRLYNYGTFNFGDPLFIPKFTYGYLRYYLSVTDYQPMLRFYRRQGRPVLEQPLNLSREQRTAVYRFLRTNAQPENRYYQYDFFFDNCSTRIRDVLKETLGENVDFSAVPRPDRSFRELLDPYVASRPFLDLGFDLALGLPADQRPTASEVMFLPEHLLRAFKHATVTVGGRSRPLVARTDTVQWIDSYDAHADAFDWPLALSVGLFVLVLGGTVRQASRTAAPGRTGDAILLALTGCVGLAVCYLWFVSTYSVTDNNLNLLWAWPTHLYAAYLLSRRPAPDVLGPYLAATAGMTGLFVLGWPVWPQNFHLAVLPLALAVAIRSGWWALVLDGVLPPGGAGTRVLSPDQSSGGSRDDE